MYEIFKKMYLGTIFYFLEGMIFFEKNE